MEKKGKYVLRDSVEPKYVNRVFGGAGIDDEFVINFFYERFTEPKEYKFIVEEKKDPKFINNYEANGIIREVTASITMDYSSAKHLHDWLGEELEYCVNGSDNYE